MEGWIGLEALKLHCHLGIEPDERAQPQEVIVDLAIRLHMGEAIRCDNLQSTVDYRTIASDFENLVKERAYRLIESLAGALIQKLARHSSVIAARIKLRKPRALESASASFVELEWQR